MSVSAPPFCPGNLLRLNPAPRLSASILLCRFLRQIRRAQRALADLAPAPRNKALRLRLGAGTLAVRLPPDEPGEQKRRTQQMFTLKQITLIGFAGSEADVHHTQNG